METKYITKVNNYYNDNKLINNKAKTKIMILTNNNKVKTDKINVNNTQIVNSSSIKILGTVFNDQLDWSTHLKHKKTPNYQP